MEIELNLQNFKNDVLKMSQASVIRELNLLRGNRKPNQEELQKIEILSEVSRKIQVQRNNNFDW